MRFKPAIVLVVACPFVTAMADRFPDSLERVVSLILVRVDQRRRLSELLNQPTQGAGLGVAHHAPPNGSGFSPDDPHHRPTVMGIGGASASFVSTLTRGGERVEMLVPFFPRVIG